MEWVKTVSKVVAADEKEKKFLFHELKYAMLGVALFIIFTIPWVDSLIKHTFPGAKGPMTAVYKIVLFVAIFYIIQKTEWFQKI